MSTSRQLAWQKRKRVRGLCVCCGKPTTERSKTGPWSTSRKKMAMCPTCNEKNNARRRTQRAIKVIDTV